MSEVLSGIALAGFMFVWITAAAAWFAAIVFGIKASRCTRPGTKLSRSGMHSPTSLVDARLYTKEGLRYRRQCFISLGIFIACCVGTLLVAAVTGNLKFK